MSHITAPTRDPVTQTNTSTTQQTARAVNIDSPNSTSISTNTSSTEQTNSLSGPTGTGSDYGTIQTNHSTTLQFAIAVNYDSPDATAIATNISFTEQVNGITADGTRHGGTVTQVNDSSIVQIDIALNIDSPDAVAIAGNSNVTEQANELTTGGTPQNGSVVQVNTNSTTEFGIALNIDSPGAIALAGNSSISIQENLLGPLLADLGQGSFVSGTPGARSSLGADQHKPDHGGCVSSPGALALASNSSTSIQVNLLETLLADLGQPSFIGGTHGAGPSLDADHHKSNHDGFASSPGGIALASNSGTSIEVNLLGTLLHEVGLSLTDLGLPSFISGTHGAGPSLGADQHEPNHGSFVMPHLASRFADSAPVHPS